MFARTLTVAAGLLTGCALVVDLPEGSDPSSTGGAAGGGGVSGGSGGSASCKLACDCDDDGVQNQTCGGTDCDDDDADVKPGQSAYAVTPSANPKVGFDYDCSGTADREHTSAVKCLGLSLAGCDTTKQGFLEELPECGQLGEWGSCKKGAVACEKDVIDSSKKMACK